MVSRREHRFLANVSLLFLSLLFAALLGEGIIRVLLPHLRVSLDTKLNVEYDRLLGWRKIANKKASFSTPEYSIVEVTNSRGIRGPEYPYDKPRNEYRILVLGDSFAEGYTVEFDQVSSEVLKRTLNSASPDAHYEVINAGTGGWSTDQELLYFRSEGKKYHPDLVILMFAGNDVWSNVESRIPGGYKPYFTLANGELRLMNVPVPLFAPQSWYRKAFLTIRYWLNERSYLYRFIRVRMMRSPSLGRLVAKLRLKEGEDAEQRRDERAGVLRNDLELWERTPDAYVRRAWEVSAALIRELKRETDAAGSKLIVFCILHRPAIYADEWEMIKREYKTTDEKYDPGLIAVRLGEICRSDSIDFVDPTPVFVSEANRMKGEGKRLYFVKDGHWTVYGHRLAGEILAKHIQEAYGTGRR